MPEKKHTEPAWNRQEGESAQAFEAFLAYLEMGPERSITKVVQKLNKSRAIIGRWSAVYHWPDRCRAWDNHIRQEAQKAAVQAVREMNRRHAQMALSIQTAAMTALKELGSNMINPKNFASVVKLAADLERQSLAAQLEEAVDGESQMEDDPITRSLKETYGDAI